jgi:hypothetical protein
MVTENDIASHSALQLVQMPQRTEMRCAEDDWTGKKDAAERRKLQNRLNQRLYREQELVM